jgi:hypothetical protein
MYFGVDDKLPAERRVALRGETKFWVKVFDLMEDFL